MDLLEGWRRGDREARNALMPLVEVELRRLAGSYMKNERSEHTLQPTALVNEAWLRLAQQNQPAWESRSHFLAIAAQYMRQVLVDHARRKRARKRGDGAAYVGIDDAEILATQRSADLVALDDGMQELARFDPRQAQIVELHFFGGLTYEEIAEFLGIGRTTVIRDIRVAQAWLKNYISR